MATKERSSKPALAVFDEYRQVINASIERYFSRLSTSFDIELTAAAKQALAVMREFTLRPGKRIRGALAAMAYDEASGKRLSRNGQSLAVVLELLQSYILILDDITDKSEFRRGEPTVHRLFETAAELQLSSHDAEQLAMYSAMIIQHLTNQLLACTAERPEQVLRTLEVMHKNLAITGFGQMDDIMQEVGQRASHDDIIRKYSFKTSYYTFINPLHMGMALAGVTDRQAIEQVAAFGVAAGVAFQIHDDYLGIFGSSEATGKPNADDIREGKLTILTQYALEHGTPADASTLRRYLGNKEAGDVEVQAVRSILQRSGATMNARVEAEHYAAEAVHALQGITVWDSSFKMLLSQLLQYSTDRES